MPRQHQEKSRKNRGLLVLSAIQTLKKASAKSVIQYLVNNYGFSHDQPKDIVGRTFERRIQEDLKFLADQNRACPSLS